jgi:hypothetical protein
MDMGFPYEGNTFSTSELNESTDPARERGLVDDQGPPSYGRRTGVARGHLGQPTTWIEGEPRMRDFSSESDATSSSCCPGSKDAGVRDEPLLPPVASPLDDRGTVAAIGSF